MVVFVNVVVVVGVVVDEVVIPSELSKHSLSLRCQNLRQKMRMISDVQSTVEIADDKVLTYSVSQHSLRV